MAKIDIRENRAEMPERRNVLRKVISPAVAEVAVEATDFAVGDKLLITGPTTGALWLNADEIRFDLKPVERALQKQRVSIPVPEKVRPNDKLFKLEKVKQQEKI